MNIHIEIGTNLCTAIVYIVITLIIWKGLSLAPQFFSRYMDNKRDNDGKSKEKQALIDAKQKYETHQSNLQKREEMLKYLISHDEGNKDKYYTALNDLYNIVTETSNT